MADKELHWADYLILAVFLVISLGIGIYHSMTGGKQKTVEEFIMANRALSVIPLAISVLVSYHSAIAIIGLPAEIYAYGFQYLIWTSVVYMTCLSLASLIIVPWIYPLQISSVNEYLSMRFNSRLLTSIAACLSLANAVLYTGIAMYAPSAAFEAVTGFPVNISVPLMSVVCIVYTALGGMRAVIWTDVFQFFVLTGGLIAIFIKGLIAVGGFSNALRLLDEQDRMNYIILTPDPRVRQTLWEFLIGLNIQYTCSYGLSQPVVQRYSATKSLRKAKLTILLNIPGFLMYSFLMGSLAIISIAYYISIDCDPYASKQISSPNQLLPLFVTNLFSSNFGFTGLFLATLYGGTLSTVSSTLSGCAANCWKDILNWKFDYLPESRKALITRLLVILFGALATGVAFLAEIIPGPIMQVTSSLATCIVGPYYGLLILGGLSRRVNLKGTLVGGACGLAVSMWLSVGSILTKHKHPPLHPFPVTGCFMDNLNMSTSTVQTSTEFSFFQTTTTQSQPQEAQLEGLQNFYAISYMWFMSIGLFITVLTGFIASLILSDKKDQEKPFDQRLLIPWSKILGFSDSSISSKSSDSEIIYDSISKVNDSPVGLYLDSSKNISDIQKTITTLGKHSNYDSTCL